MIVILHLQHEPRRRWIKAAVVALLLVEQVQLRPPLYLDRAAQNAMLTEVGRPPTFCASFFVVAARPDDQSVQLEARHVAIAWGGQAKGAAQMQQYYRHNVDAMLIAAYYHVPTINGFSSFNPPDWQLAYPRERTYSARVARYVRNHKLTNVCGLDRMRSPHWFHFNPRVELQAG